MSKFSRLVLVTIVVSLALLGCHKEKEESEEDQFSFVVYPGAHYLPHLTELTKQAHKVISPNAPEPPPTAIYDTDASVDDVANFYVKAYGYPPVAPDATNNLSSAKPPAPLQASAIVSNRSAPLSLIGRSQMARPCTSELT